MTNYLETLLTNVLAELGYEYPVGAIISEPPPHVAADFAVNVALIIGKKTGENPRDVAEKVKDKLLAGSEVIEIEIAGPGFLNLRLSDKAYAEALGNLSQSVHHQTSLKVVVEYISANPTGPLHIGNARGGPIGETIARILESLGYQVKRDFYVNDIGGQADMFARSVLHYYKIALGEPSEFPERGYPAPYVEEMGAFLAKEKGPVFLSESLDALRQEVIGRMVSEIKTTATRMGISFDTWSLQGDLETSGRAQSILEELRKNDAVLEKDGALWLKSGMSDDDRETVLVKSDGAHTYFLDDIAFYHMKLDEWKNDYGVCVLGANHSGHIPRMHAGLKAIGMDPKRYHGTLYQYVQLKESGETKRMAKREGTFVTADEVLDEIPLDVFNWFMLSKAAETHLDFDLALAKDTSEKNPVYYVQYAHARIHSILGKAGETQVLPDSPTFNAEERSLIRHLSNFNAVLHEISTSYRTHLLPTYLFELATRFHHFYAHHRVLEAEEATPQRLLISRETANALVKGLNLLNISAPEHMGA